MPLTRREFLVSSAALAAAIAQLEAQGPQVDADAVFDRALVIDALSAAENWNDPEPIFAAYQAAGLTTIHTSLANTNHTVTMRALAQWQGSLRSLRGC
jgi:hypothetical protein